MRHRSASCVRPILGLASSHGEGGGPLGGPRGSRLRAHRGEPAARPRAPRAGPRRGRCPHRVPRADGRDHGAAVMIKLVIDPSAVLAYTQRKHDVLALLGEVDEVILAGLALAETRSELVYSEELYLL